MKTPFKTISFLFILALLQIGTDGFAQNTQVFNKNTFNLENQQARDTFIADNHNKNQAIQTTRSNLKNVFKINLSDLYHGFTLNNLTRQTRSNYALGSDTGGGFGVQYFLGKQLKTFLSAGLGTEISIINLRPNLSFFLHARGYLNKKQIAPAFNVQFGINHSLESKKKNHIIKRTPGIFFYPSFGVRKSLSETRDLVFDIGVKFQGAKTTRIIQENGISSSNLQPGDILIVKRVYRGLAIRVTWIF